MDLLIQSFSHYPKGTALFIVAALNLLWAFYIVLIQKNYKKSLYKGYLIYSVVSMLWVISNAYFQSVLLTIFGEPTAKFMGLFANVTGFGSVIAFYYITAVLRSPERKVGKYSWAFIFFLIATTIYFNFTPGLTVIDAEIFPDGNFQLIFGDWNGFFFNIATVAILLGFLNFFVALRKQRPGIETIQFFYILFGMTLMYTSLIICTFILPGSFKIFDYVWIPPILSIADVIIVGYGVLIKRFPSLKLAISNLIKAIIALIIGGGAAYITYFIILSIWDYNKIFEAYAVASVMLVSIYTKVYQGLNSPVFHDIFGITNVEYFKKTIKELANSNMIYKNIEELKDHLKSVFVNKLKIEKVEVILLNQKNENKYKKIIDYASEEHHKIIVTKEIEYMENQEKKFTTFRKQLSSLGEIILPLYHPSQAIIGFFVLGKKPFDSIYTKEEIEALESINTQLGVLITSVLYSSELQKAVKEKTREIRKQNQEITKLLNEKTKLLAQQSDFIAVTAHELRTPLTVAILQVYETMKHHGSNKKLREEMEVLKEALNNLKNLTARLFNLLQFEFDKITLSLERVNLSEFIDRVFDDFSHLMGEKKINFKLDKKIRPESFTHLDPIYMRQLTQNLIVNAIKFTPKNGTITLLARENRASFSIGVADSGEGVPKATRKRIFEKFKSNHTMNSPGLGLGLYICSKIVELHHGKIWVEDNSKGRGALFWAKLPKVLTPPKPKKDQEVVTQSYD